MAAGLQWMIDVALWVASLPGAVGRIAAFGCGPLLVITAGLLVLCLLKTPLRWAGVLLLAIGCIWAVRTPLPDVLVAHSGNLVAVRTGEGNLSLIRRGGDSFAIKEWLAADADSRVPSDPTLTRDVRCDDIGCLVRLQDGTLVSVALAAEAFEDDCRLAGLIVTARRAPAGCGAAVIDRTLRERSGALAIRHRAGMWEITPARPDRYERPWLARPALESPAPAARSPKPANRDATPATDDLEPGD
jgi:competence protein ComEC